jgi:hypothetical protein
MNWWDESYAPIKQLFLLFIALALICIYANDIFKNNEYNKLCLGYGIFILGWIGTIVFRYLYLHYYPRPKSEAVIIEVPYGLKCLIGDPECEKADFTLFSIIHIVCYIALGYYVPNQYLIILIVSILCEFLEYFMGFQSKFILDPLINLAGYFIGSTLKNHL